MHIHITGIAHAHLYEGTKIHTHIHMRWRRLKVECGPVIRSKRNVGSPPIEGGERAWGGREGKGEGDKEGGRWGREGGNPLGKNRAV